MMNNAVIQAFLLSNDIAVASVASWQVIAAAAWDILLDDGQDIKIDHRSLPRKLRRFFRHRRAKVCIIQDFIGPQPLFDGREFETFFRISRGRFESIAQVLARENSFYRDEPTDAIGRRGATVQAKIMNALQVLGFGTSTNAFRPYFQMSVVMSWKCVDEFISTMPKVFGHYLQPPTKSDLRSILKLHEAKHHVRGMLGSLDCCHVLWKNCRKALHGSFKGKEEKASIALEAVSDYNLYPWHVSFGYPGCLNDLNILQMSPLLDYMTDGMMEELESDYVPYVIGDQQFHKIFC